ncbi:hypothetical protein [Chachezhania sediminis]|uniref:hypothetical protein n=1 Tax=Chachezhania sediminis TaxID=2599291 RepID=UPI00131AE609|nr:hypothetical protein [Chachezhania sediminis]
MTDPVRAGTGKKITVTLRRQRDRDGWWVESVQLKHPNHYSRVYFQGKPPLRTVLGGPICDSIEPNLPRDFEKGATLSSDALVKMPGLFLVGLRVLADYARDGVQTVTVRFTRAFGNLETIFLPRYRPELLRDEREELAVRALVDLVNPCLELCEAMVNSIITQEQAEMVAARAGTLARSREELGFFAGLLSRFVAQEETSAGHDFPAIGTFGAPGLAEDQTPYGYSRIGGPVAAGMMGDEPDR